MKNEEKKSSIINEDVMMERGKFTANGYVFHVKPVYLGEEDKYFSEVTVNPVLKSNDEGEHEPTDKELGRWAIALFSNTVNQSEKKKSKILSFFCKIFFRKNYHYYDNYPTIQPLIKWIEKKVTYKGKKIRFYDLERKFGLRKADIQRLFIFFNEISGF